MNSTKQGGILNTSYASHTPLWIGVVPRGTTPQEICCRYTTARHR